MLSVERLQTKIDRRVELKLLKIQDYGGPGKPAERSVALASNPVSRSKQKVMARSLTWPFSFCAAARSPGISSTWSVSTRQVSEAVPLHSPLILPRFPAQVYPRFPNP